MPYTYIRYKATAIGMLRGAFVGLCRVQEGEAMGIQDASLFTSIQVLSGAGKDRLTRCGCIAKSNFLHRAIMLYILWEQLLLRN